MTGDKVAIISVEAAVRRNEGTGDGSELLGRFFRTFLLSRRSSRRF